MTSPDKLRYPQEMPSPTTVMSGRFPSSGRYGRKQLAVCAACVFAVAVAWWLRKEGFLQLEQLLRYRAAHPFTFVLLFVATYAVSVVCALPTLPLNLVAGALWGPLLGGAIAVAGMVLGAIVAFCAARFVFGQPLARRFDNKLISWFQQEFVKSGWRFIAFLRLNPVFPAGPLNYVLGLTSIQTSTYIWATILFLLPPGMVVALAGYSMGSFMNQSSFQSGFRTVLLISTAATILVGMRYAAKYFRSQQS